MSMFNDISWGSKDNKKECESNVQLVSLFAKIFGEDWSFLGPGSGRKWSSVSEDCPQGEWDKMAEMMVTFQRKWTSSLWSHESIVQRSAQKQRQWEIVDPLLCRTRNDYNCYRTITSVNQFSIYGAVAEMCEEYESFYEERPVVGEQSSSSFAPNVTNTNVSWNIDDSCTSRITIAKNVENELKSNHNKTN